MLSPLTARRQASPVFIGTESALASTFTVPIGMIASSISLPAMPFTTSLMVPSPPAMTMRFEPRSTASRASLAASPGASVPTGTTTAPSVSRVVAIFIARRSPQLPALGLYISVKVSVMGLLLSVKVSLTGLFDTQAVISGQASGDVGHALLPISPTRARAAGYVRVRRIPHSRYSRRSAPA